VLSLFDRALQKDTGAILRPAGTFGHMHAVAEERKVL
jgi:hypothetical protein